jgi:probable rRNA maturation factor
LTLKVDVQYAFAKPSLPTVEQLRTWASAAALGARQAEVVVRIVGEDESARLNQHYRHQCGPTNVLSFPFEAPPQVSLPLLGDLVLCAPVIAREARAQAKPESSHWAHMVVHGMLHLQGYNHATDAQAREMEELEIEIMARLGFDNPYE